MYRIYSGTVAGAREAFIAGVPAISLSLEWYSTFFCSNSVTFLLILCAGVACGSSSDYFVSLSDQRFLDFLEVFITTYLAVILMPLKSPGREAKAPTKTTNQQQL